MSVAGRWGSLLRWDRELTELKARLAPGFGRRADVRQSAWELIDGVLSGIARKTGWPRLTPRQASGTVVAVLPL
jgi:hypothetical protein